MNEQGQIEEAFLPPLPDPAEEAGLPDQRTVEAETFQRPRSLRDLRPGMMLEGKVTSVAVYGVFVDIGVGREGLVHLSQLSDHPVSNPTEVVRIGDRVTVRVLEVDPRSKRISLTMREQVEPQGPLQRASALVPGAILEGTVTSLTHFGAFVDLGVGRDGLVPLSQMGRGGVRNAGDALQVGERVRVRVLDVDRKSGRIRLSMRNVYDPEALAALHPGRVVRGRVSGLAPFGAFVDVGVGKDGLIHLSEMGTGIRHPQEVLQVGQEVEVRVIELDPETQRIRLSLELEEADIPVSVSEMEEEEGLPQEATLEDLAARFSALRTEGRAQPVRRADRGEKERRAVREALRRTLESSRPEK